MGKPLELDAHWLHQISTLLHGLEYGNVLITVHDGKIVQIERTERKRFDHKIQSLSEHHQDRES